MVGLICIWYKISYLIVLLQTVSDQCADNKPPLCKTMDYESAYVPSYLSPQNIDDAALQVHLFFPLVKVSKYLNNYMESPGSATIK